MTNNLVEIYKKSGEEFDKIWSGGIKKKYGKGFALYCNGCMGKNEDKIIAHQKQLTLSLLEGIVTKIGITNNVTAKEFPVLLELQEYLQEAIKEIENGN